MRTQIRKNSSANIPTKRIIHLPTPRSPSCPANPKDVISDNNPTGIGARILAIKLGTGMTFWIGTFIISNARAAEINGVLSLSLVVERIAS